MLACLVFGSHKLSTNTVYSPLYSKYTSGAIT